MGAVVPVSNYKSEMFKPTSGVKTTLLTVPSQAWYDIVSIRVTASAGAAATCALIVDPNTGTEYTLNDAGALSTGIPYDEECLPLHLEAGAILKATPSGANQHVFVTYIRGGQTGARS